jgi:hypothetical protein
LFVKALQRREHILVEKGNWLVLSDFVGSDRAERIGKGLESGMPWRGVHYAKYSLPMVFGEGATWDGVRKEFGDERMSINGTSEVVGHK